MGRIPVLTFTQVEGVLLNELIHAEPVEVDHWQALDVSDMPQSQTRELDNVVFRMQIPEYQQVLAQSIGPHLPWAEAHLQERVGGKPLNPPPSHKIWPWSAHNEAHQDKEEKFSHTYPERFWPKFAGEEAVTGYPNSGIRFEYGDLRDVVKLLMREPSTRQAYLPVFFPEDTGAHARVRIPCTLGYHFLFRKGRLNCTYLIRSCDFIRHFADDVYMAARLNQWIARQLEVENGYLTMHIMSLHVFDGDMPSMKRRADEAKAS